MPLSTPEKRTLTGRRIVASLLALVAATLLTTRPTLVGQAQQAVRFAVIGDFGKAGPNELAVANLVKSWNPDFVITVGDNNYELGQASTIDANIGQYYHDFIGPYYGSYGQGPSDGVNRFFPSIGNHDWGDGFVSPPTVQPYLDYFTLPNNERYYEFQSGPVQLFALDSDPYEPDGVTAQSPQAIWLYDRLAASTARWKIPYFHHPSYTSSSHPADGDPMRWPFREWGATAVLAGHHHDFERILVENIPYFVNGLGGNGKDNFTFPLQGSQSRYNGDYGAMLVTATDQRITFEFITNAGIVDSYSIDAPAGPGAPNNLVGSGVPTGRIDLSWTDNGTNEQGFRVERSQDGLTFAEVASLAANVTSYSDFDVNPTPTTYFYRVSSFNASGSTAYSNVATVATVPAPPEAPVATAAPFSSSRIDLSWTDVTGEDGYRVYRRVNGVMTYITSLGSDVTAYSDTGRAPLTAYSYVIRGFNAGGESVSSNEVTATTLSPLATPTNLAAAAFSSSQVNLSWTDNSTAEDGFKILRSTDGVTFGVTAWATANAVTFANTGLLPSKTYYYRVQAYDNAGGVSGVSNTVFVTTMPLPAAPSNLTATAISSSRIDLSWTDNSTTEESFKVYRSTDGVTFTFQATVAANLTTYSNTGLLASKTYYYWVKVREAGGGESAISNIANATTLGVPQAPTGLVATGFSSSQINLTWTDTSANETGFRVDRSSDGTNFTTLASVGANITSYANTTLPPATSYYYRVAAVNAQGTSAFSNTSSAATLAAPAAPSGLGATAVSASQIDLSWADNSTTEDAFRVYRSTNGTTFTLWTSVAANATAYSDNGLNAVTTYYYRVKAHDAGDTESAFSNTANATTFDVVPSAPTNLAASAVSSTQINLSWTDNANNETSFRVERSSDGVSFGTLGSVGANVTAFSNTGLSAATTYHYRVVAANAQGDSTASNSAGAQTLPPPPAPTNLGATAISASRIDLAWTDNSNNEDAFRIYRSTNGTPFTLLTSLAPNATAYSDTGLSVATTYSYQVASHDVGGSESLSNTASAMTLGLPAAPTNLSATAVSSSQISLTWTDNSTNETGFRIDRSTDGVAFGTLAWVGANVTTYANSGLPAATTYYYRAVSYNSQGSATSNSASATTLSALGAPSNLTATVISATRVDLAWTDNASIESGFRIYRSTDGSTFTLLASVGANVTTYSNQNASPATTYYYRVLAYDSGGGQSPYSNTVMVTTPPVPNAPSNLVATAISGNQVNLSWTDNSTSESGFRIDKSSNGTTFTTLTWVGANVTSYNTTGQNLYFRVIAYDANGTSAPSNVAAAR